MDFDSRWNDDPRDRDNYGRELSQGSRGGLSNPREREPRDARDVLTRDLELPRGPERERVWARDSDVRLRGSEVRTLASVGAFRVVPAGDLRDGQDCPLDPHRGDLRHLRDQGLVETIPAIGNDRALVVLTERGRDVLERNRWSSVHREALILAGAQAIYIHTGAADLAVAEFTTDGDLVVNPEQLKTQPRLSEAMERAQFRSGVQPGSWLRDRTVSGIATTIPVDLLVPEAVAGPGRRAARLREQADRLLGPELTDIDGNREERRHTVSVFNGPAPQIRTFATEIEESEAVGAWLHALAAEGVQPHEIGVFVRSPDQVQRATSAVKFAALSPRVLDERVDVRPGSVNVATMHLAKGLEFRVVAVMARDDEVLPLQARIENVGDDGDLQEVYDTERQLLYVACTRARDRLSISAVEPASEFLDDVRG